MKKNISYFFIVFFIIFSLQSYSQDDNINQFYEDNLKINGNEFLRVKDLDVRKFINLFTSRYKQSSSLNIVTLAGNFPENWVKLSDIEYLISEINSTQKCCAYMNMLSSNVPEKYAEVGGFATIFLNSYITNSKIKLGLNSSPRVSKIETERIMNWYNNLKNK